MPLRETEVRHKVAPVTPTAAVVLSRQVAAGIMVHRVPRSPTKPARDAVAKLDAATLLATGNLAGGKWV